MIKIQTDLTELIKDYLRMKKRNKNRVKQEKYLVSAHFYMNTLFIYYKTWKYYNARLVFK